MFLTYNLKHGRDFSDELQKAKKIAEFAVRTKSNTSKDVRHIGLKSAIANQILKKYRKKHIKQISNIKLTIPGQSVKINDKTIRVPCLNLEMPYEYLPRFDHVKQVEIGKDIAHITVYIPNPVQRITSRYIGVDLNTTGHAAVASNSETGKIYKLGKPAHHIHKKYKDIRKKLQKQGKYQLLRQIKNRESRIIRNLNHHISKRLVGIAVSENCGIRFEKLKGIRKNKKHSKSFRYSLNSWSYYQLQMFTKYKAKSQGVEVAYVAPAYTSKTCSRCGSLGNRNGKKFECVRCGHADHADANASFNIGNPVSYCIIVPKAHMVPETQRIDRLHAERVACKGSTDTPLRQRRYKTATPQMMATVEPLTLLGLGACQK